MNLLQSLTSQYESNDSHSQNHKKNLECQHHDEQTNGNSINITNTQSFILHQEGKFEEYRALANSHSRWRNSFIKSEHDNLQKLSNRQDSSIYSDSKSLNDDQFTPRIINELNKQDSSHQQIGGTFQNNNSFENSSLLGITNNALILQTQDEFECTKNSKNLLRKSSAKTESSKLPLSKNLIRLKKASVTSNNQNTQINSKDSFPFFQENNQNCTFVGVSVNSNLQQYLESAYQEESRYGNGSSKKQILLSNLNQNSNSPEKLSPQLFEFEAQSRKDIEEGTYKSIRKNDAKKAIKGSLKMVSFFLPKLRKFFETKTILGKTKGLNSRARNFINDLTDYARGEVNQQFWIFLILQDLLNIIESFCHSLRLDRIPLFDPENFIKLCINTLIIGYNLFYLFIISVEVFFEAHFEEAALLHDIAMGVWISEMLIQMNTSTYHNNQFTKNRKVILRIYAKEYLLFEILPLICESYSSPNMLINILIRLPLLLKIKGIMIVLKKLEFYILQIVEKHYLVFLFKICAKVIILGHLVACCRNVVTEFEQTILGNNITWAEQVDDHDWISKYAQCLYWSFAIMMHNLSEKPTNNIEFLFTCLAMLLTSIFFGFMLSSIGDILTDLSKQQEDYKKDLNVLSRFLKRKDINLSLRRRANSSLLKYYHQQSKDKILQEKETISKLSMIVQKDILVSANEKVLRMFPFFYDMFTLETINKLYTIMEEVLYAPNQMIFTCKSGFDDSIFLVLKGQVMLLLDQEEALSEDKMQQGTPEAEQLELVEKETKKEKKKLKILNSGDSFGLFSFITGQNKVVNAQSSKFSQVIQIKRSSFLEIVRNNKQDYEKYMEIHDKILFDQKYFLVKQLTCTICGSPDHFLSQCTKSYFNKTNIYIFHRFNYSPQQIRQPYIRQLMKKFNTFQFNKKMIDIIYQVQIDNDLLDSSHDSCFNSQSDSSLSESSQSASSSMKEANFNDDKINKKKKNKLINLRAINDQSENQQTDLNEETPHNIFIQHIDINKHQNKFSKIDNIIDSEENQTPKKKKSNIQLAVIPSKFHNVKILNDQDSIVRNNEKKLSALVPGEDKLKLKDKERRSSLFSDQLPLAPQRKSKIIQQKDLDMLSQIYSKELKSSPKFNSNSNNNVVNASNQNNHSSNNHNRTSICVPSTMKRYLQNQDELENRQDEYFEWNFDKATELEYYYTRFNYTNVVKRFNSFFYQKGLRRKRTLRQKKTLIRGTFIFPPRSPKKPQQHLALTDQRSQERSGQIPTNSNLSIFNPSKD